MEMMPISLNSICVFCGSSPGLSANYEEAVRATARALVRANLRLIYGGGRVGLMGVLADAVILAGGHVTGVMPRALCDREIAHQGLSELRVVNTMHERKEVMAAWRCLHSAARWCGHPRRNIRTMDMVTTGYPCETLRTPGCERLFQSTAHHDPEDGYRGIYGSTVCGNARDRTQPRNVARAVARLSPSGLQMVDYKMRRDSSMNESIEGVSEHPSTHIRIVAAVVTDQSGRVLLVRKRRTIYFMQPGGKVEQRETPLETLAREVNEELGCTLLRAEFLGMFCAPEANEPGRIVEAMLFRAEIVGAIKPGAEIEGVAWIKPSEVGGLTLAPFTQFHVLPLVRSWRSS